MISARAAAEGAVFHPNVAVGVVTNAGMRPEPERGTVARRDRKTEVPTPRAGRAPSSDMTIPFDVAIPHTASAGVDEMFAILSNPTRRAK